MAILQLAAGDRIELPFRRHPDGQFIIDGRHPFRVQRLAAGRVDLVVESQLGAHDIVALIPIIEGAGGVIEGPDGSSPVAGGTVVAAATPELARQAWAALRG